MVSPSAQAAQDFLNAYQQCLGALASVKWECGRAQDQIAALQQNLLFPTDLNQDERDALAEWVVLITPIVPAILPNMSIDPISVSKLHPFPENKSVVNKKITQSVPVKKYGFLGKMKKFFKPDSE